MSTKLITLSIPLPDSTFPQTLPPRIPNHRINILQHLLHPRISREHLGPPINNERVGENKGPEVLKLGVGNIAEILVGTGEEETGLSPAVGAMKSTDDKLIHGFAGPIARRGGVVELARFGVDWLILGGEVQNCDHGVMDVFENGSKKVFGNEISQYGAVISSEFMESFNVRSEERILFDELFFVSALKIITHCV